MTQQDVRLAFRVFTRQPAFLIVAVLTLALGVGATTAIFSVVDAVLLRALPYPGPDQLVLMFNVPEKRPDAVLGISYRDFTEYRGNNQVFSEMAGNTLLTGRTSHLS